MESSNLDPVRLRPCRVRALPITSTGGAEHKSEAIDDPHNEGERDTASQSQRLAAGVRDRRG
jgi:hypothetical protein